jgi:hypothetical protein
VQKRGGRSIAIGVNTAQKHAKKQPILPLQCKKRAIVCSELGVKLQKIKEGNGV